MLSVIVLTYNQEATIGQTLDHIVAQQGVDMEVIIGDDASADGTRAVCEEYAARYAFVRLMPAAPNKGILRNYLDCLAECRGEYVAGCAGDDFWPDHLKLLKQAAFLDANPDYGVVHGAVMLMDASTGMVAEERPRRPADGWIKEKIFFHHIVEAPTACFRRSLTENIDREEWLRRGFLMEDLPMWIEFAQHAKFKYMPEHMTTYRIWPESACRGGGAEKQIRFAESARDVRYYFWDKYRPASPRRRIFKTFRRRVLKIALRAGDRQLFREKSEEFGAWHAWPVALAEKIKGR